MALLLLAPRRIALCYANFCKQPPRCILAVRFTQPWLALALQRTSSVYFKQLLQSLSSSLQRVRHMLGACRPPVLTCRIKKRLHTLSVYLKQPPEPS